MFETIWQAVREELSGERARDCTARFWEHARWNSFDRMQQTAVEIAAVMAEIGLRDVQVLEYPADGETAHGGWVMPQAWDAREARLEIASPEVGAPLLACYSDCPQSLMMYSAPTPPGGVEADVVLLSDDGADVGGKIVLADGVGLDIGLRAFERGAVGVVSDAMRLAGSVHAKHPAHFDEACQWHNYTIPPWKAAGKGFGFSISPAAGRRLRELMRRRAAVRLRAIVETRLYDGVIPCVTGLLPGETSEEIALTGHLCEPGANDNSSGCALALEVVRTVRALVERGKLRPLRRGLRPVLTFEARGYQAFLADWPDLKRLTAGVNLDMVGNDLSEARARTNVVFNYPSLPAYTDVLALALMRRLQRDDKLFHFRTAAMGLVDNVFGIPSVGAPMCVLGSWPDAYYHTSLDGMDSISPAAMAKIGRVAGTYCAFLATAGLAEAAWLARVTAAHGEREIVDAARDAEHPAGPAGPAGPAEKLAHLAEKNAARLRSICRLVGDRHVIPTVEGLAEARGWLCRWSHLFGNEEIASRTADLGERLRRLAKRKTREARSDSRHARRTGSAAATKPPTPPTDDVIDRARRLVPQATFRGSICFESLSARDRADLKAATGLTVSWGAPDWLQLTIFRSNGKRSALEIWRWLRHEADAPDLSRFCATVEFLAAHGFVRLRACLTKDDYLTALREIGLPAGPSASSGQGEVVMVHSSLSRFGHVAGGCDTVIDALLDTIGSAGTLAMPALSCSWVGRKPFDPAKTPSRVGAISEAFRRRAGVLRSGHPTHSVCALGGEAGRITADHTPDRAVFSDEGAFGQLYALDAWVLLLCDRSANTVLHLAEHRAGLLVTDLVAHVAEGGRRREVTVRGAPWHVDFEGHYELLVRRGQLHTARLGEGELYLMRCRHAVDAALEDLRKDPTPAMGRDCDCAVCRNLRAQL